MQRLTEQPNTVCELQAGGITPLTTLDYPGELAAVIFCQGCPWRCRYCHNGHLLDRHQATTISWQEILAFLQRRRGLLDAVVFSGGEPTLQRHLPAALQQARQLGFKTGLHTAGCYPDKLQAVLPLLDWVGLDIKALPEDYPAITQVPDSGERAWYSLALLQASGVPYEVRTTHLPQTPDSGILALGTALANKGVQQYSLQSCRTDNPLDPELDCTPPLPRQHLLAALRKQIPNCIMR